MDYSLANKLLYWLNDWSGYILPNEKLFKYDEMIIYYPTSTSEKLYGIKLSPENIKKIKEKFDELYF